ncbi:NACHT domain-containing protein [Aliivibrio fischeri]|uniref:NACHT domain-containing protein n=1 Tax=Aliivibrio fischeri TaxID=668 RepID=A0A6N3Z2Q8_ALIFS|nr:NACHT domain-containing protein [Aliivibrio fischeri]MUK47526.1 NACHT domain-containing protein [Aliivibrio fischeri]MUK81529.1 NACHT domain-containing protein [Aliivibrio fischeri]MUK82985.1 NACHT domain-containing protein [Aliivibrio fischeri]
MEPIITTISTIALKQSVTHFTKKLLEKQWASNHNNGKQLLEQLAEEKTSERYAEKYVSKYLRMRTLHSAESDVYLDEVYTPLTLLTVSNDDELKIEDNFTLEFSKIVNIIGIAGQGKSTILRKLFLEEIKKENKFPFFIELRRVEENGILAYLKENLEDVGLIVENDSLEELLLSNNIILLLDGFDEISTNNRKPFLDEIIKIKTRYNCSVIVTSRPDTEICHEPNISNLKVKKLNELEIIDIINKLDKKKECPEIIELIKNNNDLQETLISPILVNLLYVCYPYLDVVPENVVDFYHKLFLTLYSRHDKIKNFNREKYSNISPATASNIFDALCFNSTNKGVLEFNDSNIIEHLTIALKYNDIDKSQIENIKHDIINITCLIQKDGFDRYVFLHKSVQEFHTAKFISNLPHEHKKKFYQKLSSIIEKEDKYDNVIFFLKEIDKSDFESLLLIESFKKYNLNHLNDENKDSIISNCIVDAFNEKEIMFVVENDENKGFSHGFSSLTFGNILSSIAILSNHSRFSNNSVEDALFLAVAKFDKHHNNGLPVEFLKENATNTRTHPDKLTTTYVMPMIKCFEYSETLDGIKEEISAYIINFHRNIYNPISLRCNEMSAILDLDFNM